MRVLVTRPEEDARRTAEKLAQLGHDALIAPLVEIRLLDGPEIPLDGVQAILATSGNGIRALARRSSRRDVRVFVVGTQTANAARAEGYLEVANAAGDAKALVSLVRNRAQPDAGALLQAAGMDARRELRDGLQRAGFDVRSPALYDALEVPMLPLSAQNALRSGSVDALIVFSPRSAQIFADRIVRADLASACAPLIACCISNAAARPLQHIPFREIRIAPHPDLDTVLALLD